MSKGDLERGNRDAYFRSTRPHGPLACEPGDVVAFTRYFLKSIGASATDPMWSQRGIVRELRPPFVLVAWEEGERLVHLGNLAKPGPNLRFCE